MKKPTEEQITEYMHDKGFWVEDEAEAFFDNFESNGWLVGGRHKTPMKNWKSAVNTWIRNWNKWNKSNGSYKQSNQTHSQRQHQQAQDAHKQMELEHTESYPGTIRPIQ